MFARGGALEAFLEARERGLIRHIGITGHGADAPAIYREALRRFDFDSVLFPLNFVQMSIPTFRAEALTAECRAKDVGTMVIKTITKAPMGRAGAHGHHLVRTLRGAAGHPARGEFCAFV